MVDAEKYPQTAKMLAVKNESQAIGEFIEWLQGSGIWLCEIDSDNGRYYARNGSIEELLAEFFEIDLSVREKEQRQMLKEIRASYER